VTDLLIGIAAGVLIKLIFHVCQGVPVWRLFRARIETQKPQNDVAVVLVREAAVFSTWLTVQSAVRKVAETNDRIVIDLSQTRLVDHSVMEKLYELEIDLRRDGKLLEVVGLEQHVPCSSHPHAARRRPHVPQTA
jgi:MFS superfamily sulfate permease-like transporter